MLEGFSVRPRSNVTVTCFRISLRLNGGLGYEDATYCSRLLGGVALFLMGLALLAFPGCPVPPGCTDFRTPACDSPGCEEPEGTCKLECGGDRCDPGIPECACRTKYYESLGTNCMCSRPEQ